MVGFKGSRAVDSAASPCGVPPLFNESSFIGFEPRTRAKGGERMFLSLYVELQNRFSELNSERGASAVEYGLLVALIAAVIIGTVQILGGKLDAAFNKIVSVLP
jgi:pilus assembly protein Flp/PilA